MTLGLILRLTGDHRAGPCGLCDWYLACTTMLASVQGAELRDAAAGQMNPTDRSWWSAVTHVVPAGPNAADGSVTSLRRCLKG